MNVLVDQAIMQNKKVLTLVVVAMALGLLMSALDNTITSAAISNILKDFDGFDKMSWVFTAYILAATSTMLIFGKMSDLFGRKMFYLLGIGLFIIGSALCGAAQNIDQLIAFRAIQGMGSGALFPISFTILFTVFADPRQAAKLSGIFAGIFGISSVAGPQIGTFISDYLSWRWCFYVNIPLGILSFLIILFSLKETRSALKPKIDYFGTITLIISIVSVLLGLTWGGKDYAWNSWEIISLFASTVVFGTIFVLIERKVEEPILPLELFKNRMVVAMSVVCLCQGAIMYSAISYLPIFAVGVLGKANSSSILTPMMFSLMVGAVSFSNVKLSFRTIIAYSSIMGIVSGYLLYTMPQNAPYWLIVVVMIMLGFGAVGPLMAVAQNAVANNVDKKYLGISSSFVGFWRQIGGVLGASIMATIVNNQLKTSIEEGAPTLHIPADKIDQLANPELLVRASDHVPSEILGFLRDSLGSAINHGYILAICFALLGLSMAFYAGPGKMQPGRRGPSKSEESAVGL